MSLWTSDLLSSSHTVYTTTFNVIALSFLLLQSRSINVDHALYIACFYLHDIAHISRHVLLSCNITNVNLIPHSAEMEAERPKTARPSAWSVIKSFYKDEFKRSSTVPFELT